jgi:hypothetical protein
MNNVIDISTRRSGKVQLSQASSGIAPGPEMEAIALIACSGCQQNDFQLACDGRVICPKCLLVIGPLRWWDTTLPRPPAA